MFIVGYIVPSDFAIIKGVVAAFGQRPHGPALMAAGDFNANLAEPEGNPSMEEIEVAVMNSGMEGIMMQFHDQAREGGEAPDGLLEMVGSGGH